MKPLTVSRYQYVRPSEFTRDFDGNGAPVGDETFGVGAPDESVKSPEITRPDSPAAKAGQPAPAVAVKADQSKSRLDLISSVAIEGLGHVLGHGAQKYAAHNWRLGLDWSRTLGALLRHTLAFMRGEDIDPDSKLPHVDHIMCNAMFLSEYFHTKTGKDDRFKRGAP